MTASCLAPSKPWSPDLQMLFLGCNIVAEVASAAHSPELALQGTATLWVSVAGVCGSSLSYNGINFRNLHRLEAMLVTLWLLKGP